MQTNFGRWLLCLIGDIFSSVEWRNALMYLYDMLDQFVEGLFNLWTAAAIILLFIVIFRDIF